VPSSRIECAHAADKDAAHPDGCASSPEVCAPQAAFRFQRPAAAASVVIVWVINPQLAAHRAHDSTEVNATPPHPQRRCAGAATQRFRG